MQKIILLFMLTFNFSAYSIERDCINEYMNYEIYENLSTHFSGQYYGGHLGNKKQLDCVASKENENLNQLAENLEHSIKYTKITRDRMRAEMKLKNSITAEKYFSSEFIGHRGSELGHEEICEVLDAQVKKWTPCSKEIGYTHRWLQTDITHGDIVKVCKEQLPDVIRHYKACD